MAISLRELQLHQSERALCLRDDQKYVSRVVRPEVEMFGTCCPEVDSYGTANILRNCVLLLFK